jgi:hypothetical protein
MSFNRKPIPWPSTLPILYMCLHVDGRNRPNREDGLLHSHWCRERQAASTHAVHQKMYPKIRNIATVRPQDVINTVRNDHGTPVGYHMAWRALERYKSEKRADDEASFMCIADFLENLAHKNPGTKLFMETTSDSWFLRAFLCPGTLAKSIECCRPLVVLDACHSRSRYFGIIISACSTGGNGQIVPLAIGIA